MDGYIGMIMPSALNFAPQAWSMCNGQAMPVSQYTALFSLIGTRFGGNQSAFNLPDLRGRVMIGSDQSSAAPYGLGIKGGSTQIAVNQLPGHTHPANLTLGQVNAEANVELAVSAKITNQTVQVSGQMVATTEQGSSDVPFNGATFGDLTPGSNKFYVAPTTDPTKAVNLASISSSGSFSADVTGSATGNLKLPVTAVSGGSAVTVQPNATTNAAFLPPYVAINMIICVNGIYPDRP